MADPAANGEVNAVVVSGDDLYIGGDFATIGSRSRERHAQFTSAP